MPLALNPPFSRLRADRRTGLAGNDHPVTIVRHPHRGQAQALTPGHCGVAGQRIATTVRLDGTSGVGAVTRVTNRSVASRPRGSTVLSTLASTCCVAAPWRVRLCGSGCDARGDDGTRSAWRPEPAETRDSSGSDSRIHIRERYQ